ncbi:MAG: FtsH protease activity modulator HflK [Bdellovibrio sp.]
MVNDPQWTNDVEKMKKELGKSGKIFFMIFLVLIVVGGAKSSYYTVEPDEEAIIMRFGKYIGTYPPGLHFKLPYGVDEVINVKTKRVLQAEFGFRTQNTNSSRTQYSQKEYDDESLMLTGDLNVADVEWVVQYQISDPFKYIFQATEPERNIKDVSESIMRRVVGDRLVNEVLTTGRVEIASDAKDLMQDVLDRYDIGVKIVTVKLQDVNPPHVVKPSFNEVNEAKQEQEKVINQAEENYNKVIPEAKGQAEKIVSEAEGYATSVINRAMGDAEKFKAVLTEYQRAPAITKKRLYLETMEELFKRFKNVTIVDGQIKGLLPIFNEMKKAGE